MESKTKQVFLRNDPEIAGQKFAVFSFAEPWKTDLEQKEMQMFYYFLESEGISFRDTHPTQLKEMKRRLNARKVRLEFRRERRNHRHEQRTLKMEKRVPPPDTDSGTEEENDKNAKNEETALNTTTNTDNITSKNGTSFNKKIFVCPKTLKEVTDEEADYTLHLERGIKLAKILSNPVLFLEKYKEFKMLQEDKFAEDISKSIDDRCTTRAVKVRGVYSDINEAKERVRELSKIDKSFNTYVHRVGQWVPTNPKLRNIKEVEYADQKLNELMKGAAANKQYTKQFFEERNQEMLEDAIEEEEARQDDIDRLEQEELDKIVEEEEQREQELLQSDQ